MYGLNRYICDVFEEMRKCAETGNYSYLPGLIEEAQMMANRMEKGLSDINDLKRLHRRIKRLKVKLRKLEDKEEKHEKVL